MTEANVSTPAVDSSVVDKLISDAPDDLEFDGPSDRPERPTGKLSDLKPEDFDEDDGEGGDDEPSKKPEPKAAKPKDEPAKEKQRAADVPPEPPEPKDARAALPKDRGTEDKPWTIKDLPEDGFVQVKIDGKPSVVSLKELASGYIRMETFHGAHNRANQAYDEARQIAEQALQERGEIRSAVREMLSTPQKLFEHLLHDPDVMEELGFMIAKQYKTWQEKPEARAEHKHQLRERALQSERQRLQQEKERWEAQQRESQQLRAAQERWRPVHQEALKENGFPKLTPEFQRVFKALFQAEWEATQGQVTPEAYKQAFKRAMAVVKPESTVADRRPAPASDPQRRPAARNGSNGQKDWSGMSLSARLRDPGYLLR